MTKLLFILLIPSILLGNTKSIFDDYLYNVNYYENGEKLSIQNVICVKKVKNVKFMGKNYISGKLNFRQKKYPRKLYIIYPKDIISITDLQTNEVIFNHDNLKKSIDKKRIITTMIAIPVLAVSIMGIIVIGIANSSYPFPSNVG